MALTSQDPTSMMKNSEAVGMQWLPLGPSFRLSIEQAGTAKRDPERKDFATAICDSIGMADTAETETESKLTGSWKTVDAQKAALAATMARADLWPANHPTSTLCGPLEYRSNAVVNLWWPSPFLAADCVLDPAERMPPLS